MSEHEFNMGEFANLVYMQSKNIEAQGKNVDAMIGKINDLSTSIDETKREMREGFNTFTTQIKEIKDNYEITTQQAKNIRGAIHKQVCKLLGVPVKEHEQSITDKITMNKYGNLFHSRCYSEVARKGHLASPYAATTNQNYIPAMADIEAWTPSKGIEGLKREADENALANK